MPVPALSAISSALPAAPVSREPVGGPTGPDAGFSASLTAAIDDLQQAQSTSDALAVKAVTGELSDIHRATIAATRAEVTLELAATVRDKGLEAFHQIMNMRA